MVLAAGAGTRLRPLTDLRPKALCPVGGRPLVDLALERLAPITAARAVNAHHHAAQLADHLAAAHGDVHVSVERRLLGSAGALGRLRAWLEGRDCVVVNADVVHDLDLVAFVDARRNGDRDRVALLVADPPGTPFGPGLRLAAAWMPWEDVAELSDEPSGVYDLVWAPADADGRLDVVGTPDGRTWFDCGTARSYLAANLWMTGGESVIGEGAIVAGTVEESVVWDGARVWPGERLVRAIRANDAVTVLVRP